MRVWWIPQIPGEPFLVPVPDLAAGRLVCDTLADYDNFQLEQNVKPDFSNAGGIQMLEDVGEGLEWVDAFDDQGNDAWPEVNDGG